MIRQGTEVKWQWGKGEAEGKVIETYIDKVEKTLSGNKVIREGTQDNKALLIEQEDGTQVLKLESEVKRND